MIAASKAIARTYSPLGFVQLATLTDHPKPTVRVVNFETEKEIAQ